MWKNLLTRCQNLYRRFVKSDEDPPKEYYDALGADRDYNVDLIPKFIMAAGMIVHHCSRNFLTVPRETCQDSHPYRCNTLPWIQIH